MSGHQTITWITADLLFIGPQGTKYNESWINMLSNSFQKMHWEMASVYEIIVAEWRHIDNDAIT